MDCSESNVENAQEGYEQLHLIIYASVSLIVGVLVGLLLIQILAAKSETHAFRNIGKEGVSDEDMMEDEDDDDDEDDDF